MAPRGPQEGPKRAKRFLGETTPNEKKAKIGPERVPPKAPRGTGIPDLTL